jgi:Bifunctional DNA primase/polymerase, N-terminal
MSNRPSPTEQLSARSSSNGHDPSVAALRYMDEAIAVISYPAGRKKSLEKDWQKHPLTREQAMALGSGVNLGNLTGKVSGGLYDLGCDVPQAVRCAELWAPNTDRIHGRKSNPASHRWYYCLDEPDHATEQWKFPEPATASGDEPAEFSYVELRGGNDDSGSQTMVPPSWHPDGEWVEWASYGPPAVVPYADLRNVAVRIASATLTSRHWPAKGARDEAAMALAGGLIRGTDWSDDEIDAFTTTVAVLANDEEHRDRDKAAATRAKIDQDKLATGWPRLKTLLFNGDAVVKTLTEWLDVHESGVALRGRQRIFISAGISEMEKKVLTALAKANDPARGEPRVYERNGRLVRVHYDEANRPIIAPMRLAGLMSEIDELVQFQARYKDGTPHPVIPPDKLVAAVLESPDYDLPALAGISEVPVLRPDGTILTVPGYDVATGLLYRPVPGAAEVPPVPDDPTDAEIEQAIERLNGAIGDFPYRDQADRAHAFAGLLSPVLRAALAESLQPLGLSEAPLPGTGKGLLAEVTATIAIGHYASIPAPRDEAEWGKVITTALLQGHPVNVFDNVTGLVDSAALAGVLTARRVTPRLLGTNQMPDLLNNAVWMMTGNNLRLSADIARRTYRIRLDAGMARPWTRPDSKFKHARLLPWVVKNRHLLLHDALTIARAWYARGRPVPSGGVPPFGN